MSQIQKFLFDGLPVRGVIVRLTDAWQEVLKRRANNPESGAYPAPVHTMLGEMVAGLFCCNRPSASTAPWFCRCKAMAP